MPKKICSFCGRGEDEVKLLITGLNGYICEDCAQQAYRIVNESGVLGQAAVQEEPVEAFKTKRVPKPREIKEYLDQYIIGQKNTCQCRFITISNVCSNL